MMRHVINFFITGFIVWLFQQIGWIQINHQVTPFVSEAANGILTAGIIGLIFVVGLWIANLVFMLFVVFTLGMGCILYPIYLTLLGIIGFWAVGTFLPGWITVQANTWQIILMGIMVSWIRIHSTNNSSSESD